MNDSFSRICNLFNRICLKCNINKKGLFVKQTSWLLNVIFAFKHNPKLKVEGISVTYLLLQRITAFFAVTVLAELHD